MESDGFYPLRDPRETCQNAPFANKGPANGCN